MKKLTITVVLGLVCLHVWCYGQDSKPVDVTARGVQVGQAVPDILISDIHNYKAKAAKLSDFKGKLLILDFWATWCSPCVAMIPRMDSLQKEFEGKVQFLSVTYQKDNEVFPFLEKFEKQKRQHYNLPMVVSDTLLRRLFPHIYLPHYVWINETGVVVAVTEQKDVTSANIRSALEGGINELKRKKDISLFYNKRDPLFFNKANLRGGFLLHSTVLTRYIDGLSSGWYQNLSSGSDSSGFRRITVTNCSIPQLYQVAFMDGKRSLGWNVTRLEVKDTSGLNSSKQGGEYFDWMKQGNGFCYELVIPDENAGAAWDIMKDDLNRAFPNYQVTLEKQTVSAFSLIRTSKEDKLRTKGKDKQVIFNTNGGSVQNYRISVFVQQLASRWSLGKPLYNDTGYAENVDIAIDANINNLSGLNKELAKYDLRIVEAPKEVELLIIRDRLP